jgi:uncharacterized protein YdbL (DUF1318 family)
MKESTKTTVKNKAKKKPGKAKSRFLIMALISTILVGGTASQASAATFNPLQFIGDLKKKADSFLFSIKNDPAISKILGEINEVTNIFLPQIQRFTNISNADINKVKGVLNVLAPSDTQRAIDEKEKASKSPSVIPSEQQASRAATSTASNTVLSKEAQELDKKNLTEISDLVQSSGDALTASSKSADAAQEASSSQDVLKILASQNSNQAAINAAQLRLLALQNNNLQAIKTQLAVANQASASNESRIQGETQRRVLQDDSKSIAAMEEAIIKYQSNLK